ncbi:MAG: radical SAM protein [Lachnospiraceae bacterium]|nr:radical SAM protein [Lachnospiraceae bacterium]
MAEDFRIDSHKLLYHPQRVADFIAGNLIYPIEMEVGISGACNHRCIFCAVDYMEYKPRMIDADVLCRNLEILGKKGLKSIIYAGEGDPMAHPEVVRIINETKKNGIDAAVSTNGVLFTKDKLEGCLKSLTWVRYSIAGATPETYSKIHQCHIGDFDKAIDNMRSAADVKREKGLSVTLGAQLLLLPENKNEVEELARIVRDIGFDYFTVKPFSQHPQSKAKLQVDYSESEKIGERLKKYETDDFKIYFRSKSIENLGMEKPYHDCCGLHFMTYMDSAGEVFPCIVFMGKDEFNYGNINDNDFDVIWESDRATKIREIFKGEFIKKNCRKNCRLDEINKYLDKIVYPVEHVNFI